MQELQCLPAHEVSGLIANNQNAKLSLMMPLKDVMLQYILSTIILW